MAHVLLPCDLPIWPDIQRHLTQLKTCKDVQQMTQIMDSLYDICYVSLDPDDVAVQQDREPGHPGISKLGHFIDNILTDTERNRFMRDTLPDLASRAADLKRLRPPRGFLYSLQKDEEAFRLDRAFVASLIANAFFSTFPKRNAKTHPTLQDFRMVDFFTYLTKRNHQKKFKAFLRYFESLDPDPGGYLKFSRKVVNGPSLPGWLCSDRPLVPLILRLDGGVHDAEPEVYRGCSCSPLIGGDVLKASTSKEARLFFLFPELLVILSFVESLTDEEALIAENTEHHQGLPAGLCFLDTFTENSNRQFEDKFLLRALNKAFAAFQHELPLPSITNKGLKSNHIETKKLQKTPSSSRTSSSKLEDISNKHRSRERRRSSASQSSSKALGSHTSSRSSMKTASQSSVEPLMPLRDDHYYTADEDSEGVSGCASSRRQSTQEMSLSHSRSAESIGFVLGEESEGDDNSLPQHERLDDFRKRIRKRTRRRLSRRSSRSSYLTSSGSSDMEDISEDPEDLHRGCCRIQSLRPASSEPSVVLALDESISPLSPGAALLSLGAGKKMMVTSSNGHLKAYSYDGVAPNLPVPFKAKFRRRRHHSNEEGRRSFEEQHIPCCWRKKSSTPFLDPNKRLPVAVEACCEEEGDNQLKVTIMWLAASMADLQALILYTLGQSQLREVSTVYGKVRSREWTVGDLSCEVLRFCRNRLYPSRKTQQLFHQIIGQTSSSISQESLDLSPYI